MAGKPIDNILLIGYRGSGKSTVGRLLAERLGLEFTDTDETITRQEGRDIAEIFARDGETHFRDLESRQLAALASRRGLVISVGGGAVERPQNRRLIADLGHVLWLTASANELHRRIENDALSDWSRPALTTRSSLEEIRDILARRTPLYEQLATIQIDTTGQTPQEVAALVLQHLGGRGAE